MAVIPTYQSQESLQSLPGARVRSAATPDAYGVGVIQAGQRFLDSAIEKRQEYEYAEALEALNAFQADVDKLHLDPNSGLYNTRKRGAASGMQQDADASMRTVAKQYLDKMSTPFMKNAFSGQARRILDQQNRANSKWEYSEIEAYKTEEATASQNNAYNKISLYYDDDAMVEVERQNILDALEYQLRGAGPEVRAAKMAEMENNIGLVRFYRMVEDDPKAAAVWYEANKNSFTGEWQGKIEQNLKGTLERIQVQETVDALLDKFGTGSVAEVSKYVRENYEGELEDAIMSRYKMVSNERTASEGASTAAISRAQNEYWEQNFYQRYEMNGLPAPADEVDRAYREGKIGVAQRARALRANAGLATRSNIEKMLSGKDPNAWNAMSPEQREEATMRGAGITQGDRDRSIGYLRQAISDPESGITAKDIDEYYSNMLITKGEAENYKSILKARTTEEKNLVKTQTDRLKTDLGSIFTEQAFFDSSTRKAYSDQARALFLDSVTQAQEMGLKGQELFEYLRKARQQAIATVVSDLNKNAYGFVADPNAFDQQVTQTLESIGSESNASKAPAFRVDKIDLATPIATVPRNNSYSMAMTPQGTYVSSDYYASRDGGKRQHMAIDVAAPEGSPIYSGDFGSGLTVSSVSSSETAGNTVELSGTRPDGKTVKVRLIHLQNLSGIRQGMAINPGDYIGPVGNTGSTSKGAHMHLEVYVNDKRVDPEKYLSEVAEMRRQEQVKRAETVDTTGPEPPKESKSAVPPPVVSADKSGNTAAIDTLMQENEAASADIAPPAAKSADVVPSTPKSADVAPTIDELETELLGGVLGGNP